MRIVRFVKTYRMYQPGERAGFSEQEAASIIKAGLAVDPDAQAETPDPKPNASTDRQKLIADAILFVSEDDFTQSGRPDVAAINAVLAKGVPEYSSVDAVSAAERDAVWALVKGE